MKAVMFAVSLLLIASPAFAAEATKPEPAKPTCGRDATECQKVVDDLTQKLGIATIQVQGLQRQRDAAQSAAMNTDLNAFVQQEMAKIAAHPQDKPK